MVRAPAATTGGPGFDSQRLAALDFLLPAAWLTNVGALVQLGCYQYRYEEWGEGSMHMVLSSRVQLLLT